MAWPILNVSQFILVYLSSNSVIVLVKQSKIIADSIIPKIAALRAHLPLRFSNLFTSSFLKNSGVSGQDSIQNFSLVRKALNAISLK